MINVAVITGGYSGERQISLNSAQVVMKALDPKMFLADLIVVDKDAWYKLAATGERIPVEMNDFTVKERGLKKSYDVAFIALHGTPGEDGKLQGYLEMQGIPYTSCDSITSALTFDKYFTKQVVVSAGVFTAPAVVVNKNENINTDKIVQVTGLPCFVKPDRGGSSVGMSKVTDINSLQEAIEKAFHEDSRILVEKYIKGRELTCGVMRSEGEIVVFPVTEVISKNDFFDFEAKYTPGMAEEVTPAIIETDLEIEVKATSSLLFKVLNCKGVVRFDYIVSDEGLCFLEVNTVPGMSEASIVPNQALIHGWNHQELFTRMLMEALIYQK